MTGMCMYGGGHQWCHALTPMKYSFVIVHSPRTTVGPDDRTDGSSSRGHHMEAGLGDRVRTVTLMPFSPFLHSSTDVWSGEVSKDSLLT